MSSLPLIDNALTPPAENLRGRAFSGLLWALLQTWGGKLLTLVLYFILARLLNPAEFGIASAVALVLLLLSVVSEFGFGDALVQRYHMRNQDINLPFFVSVSASIGLAIVVTIFSSSIETALKAPGLAPYLIVTCAFAPLGTATSFQEVIYKRNLDFKPLAIRLFIGLIISGVVGVSSAWMGFGAWSLIAQQITFNVISTIWLWSRPRWLPTFEFDWMSFRALKSFGLSIVSTRLVDFFSTRAIDFLILTLHGVTALGLYAVGAKVYQTLMELLSKGVMDVALSTLSKIANDRPRLAQLYLKGIGFSALFASAAFIGMAALSPEIARVLFGAKWVGSEDVMRPLMLIGSIQCIQFMNGPYLTAMGRPHLILFLTMIKLASVIPAMLLIPSANVGELAVIYAAALLVVTPFTFAFVIKELKLRVVSVIRAIFPFLLAAALAYVVVQYTRPWLAQFLPSYLLRAMVLGSLFISTYIATISIAVRQQALASFALIRERKK